MGIYVPVWAPWCDPLLLSPYPRVPSSSRQCHGAVSPLSHSDLPTLSRAVSSAHLVVGFVLPEFGLLSGLFTLMERLPGCPPFQTESRRADFSSCKLRSTNTFSERFRFFTYGNFPLEQHLKQIHEEALSKFEKIEPNTAVPAQKPWDKPVSSPSGE